MRDNGNDRELISRSYYNAKGDYNYDIMSLINENFDFYDFIKNGKNTLLTDNGAFLVISNNQYVLGYNRGMGTGGHDLAFARAFSEINGGVLNYDSNGNAVYKSNGKLNFSNVNLNCRACESKYITARIFYEYACDNQVGTPIFSGGIYFDLASHGYKITQEQFHVFEQFYNDYNRDIKISTKNLPYFYISFRYLNELGEVKEMGCRDLEPLYNYLKNNIDYDKEIEDDKNIIGIINNNKFYR